MIRSGIHDAAQAHILDCHAVAMQENDRPPSAALNMVQAHAIAGYE
jgi:hypothetical protein